MLCKLFYVGVEVSLPSDREFTDFSSIMVKNRGMEFDMCDRSFEGLDRWKLILGKSFLIEKTSKTFSRFKNLSETVSFTTI